MYIDFQTASVFVCVCVYSQLGCNRAHDSVNAHVVCVMILYWLWLCAGVKE